MLTTPQLAAIVKVSPRRLLAIAAARGVQPAIDAGNVKLWRPAQAAKLKPGRPGRPRGRTT